MSGSGCRKGPPGFEREGSSGARTGLEQMAGGMEKENCDMSEKSAGIAVVWRIGLFYGEPFMLDDL